MVVDDNNMHTDIMHRHTPSYGLMNVDGVLGVHSLEIEQKNLPSESGNVSLALSGTRSISNNST